MKALFHCSVVAIAIVCGALFFSIAAGGQTLQVTRLAILPLAKGTPPVDSNRQAPDCRETELIADERLDAGAQDKITGCLQQALEKALPGKLVPQNERTGADELLVYMKTSATLKAHALKLGEKLQASHVLAGTAVRYRERKGTAYGADRPASVTFSVYLLDEKTGDIVWSGAFDKTQQSLAENLLDAPAFFKGGAKWLTAQELACRGAEDIADKLKSALAGKSGK